MLSAERLLMLSHLLTALSVCLCIPAGIVAYMTVCFTLLPRYAGKLRQRHPGLAGAMLEVLLRLPSPGGEAMRSSVRYHLLVLRFLQGRNAEAEALCRDLLAHEPPAAMEADVRRRLADILDIRDEAGEAQAELDHASRVAQRGADVGSLTVRAGLLERQHRYMEAFTVYEAALRFRNSMSAAVLAEVMVKMGMAAFHGGRPDLTITWMESAIAAGADGLFLRNAYTMAGVAHGNQGHFSQAIAHSRRAVALAEREGARTEAGRALGMIASYQKNQGDVAAALETCAEIERQGWTNRTSLITLAECLEAAGNYEEANQVILRMSQFDETDQARIPHYERRQQGVASLGLARNMALQGQPESAWQHLQEAIVAFHGDAKLTFMCDGFAAWVLALLGRRGQAEAKIAVVESELAHYDQDRNIRMGGLSSLGRAQYALGDYERAAARWQAYLDAGPNPVWQPRGYFFLGDCLERLGDAEGARRAYAQATIVPIADVEEGETAWPPAPSLAAGHTTGRFVDTHEARLARQRLEQMS